MTVNWPLAVWAFGPHKKVAVACPGDLLSCEPYVFQSMGWGRPEVHSYQLDGTPIGRHEATRTAHFLDAKRGGNL